MRTEEVPFCLLLAALNMAGIVVRIWLPSIIKKIQKEYLGKFWVDSHVCDHKMLQYVIDMVGADKVVQGSDYPFPLGEAVPGELVRTAPLSSSEKEKIMGSSAKAWLGL